VSDPLDTANDTRLFDAGERPAPKALFVRDLPAGETVETILLVKESVVAQRRSGEDYLRLKVCDCTGTLEAIAWDAVDEVREIALPGAVLRMRGRYEVSQRYGPQLVLKSATLAGEGEYRLADLMDAPAMSVEQMEADLRRLVGTVRNPWLSRLSARSRRSGSASAARRPPSTTTRHTCTDCWSTRCRWARP
jgi:23S rRNA maturation-related 3'-5' exoribonuclease YhaM